MTGTKLPNGELVTQAWLAKYTGIPAGQIASTLPEPVTKEGVVKWTPADKGVAFLQVRALAGGGIDIDLPHRRVFVAQLDAWGARVSRDTTRAVWSVAEDLLERVRVATFPDAQTYGKPITMPLDDYQPARVLVASLLSEPTRVEGDPSGYARVTTNLSIAWTV